MRAFEEHGGIIGCEVGSAGVQHPCALSTDKVGNGETPEYGGVMSGVHVKCDAADVSQFGDGTFSCLLPNHVVEHLGPCDMFTQWLLATGTTVLRDEQQAASVRKSLQCPGHELLGIIREWLRIVRSGGYVGFITPDADVAERNGITCFDYDSSHVHSLSGTKFSEFLREALQNEAEMVEANSLNNSFSFQVLLKKR
jgi:hypothetical protein